MFSIYLSKNENIPGEISFGGYDLKNYAKADKEITWINIGKNERYWLASASSVKFGKNKFLTRNL